MSAIAIEPIGRVEGGRERPEDDFWGASESTIVLDERFPLEALDGIEGFSHVEVLFYFDRVDPAKIETGARSPRNRADFPRVGIFAQRGKNRPNRIGSTICRIVRRDGRRLTVAQLDTIEGTPVLDIKPVLVEFLPREPVRQPDWSRELMREYWSTK
ncbi:MAG: SAM-dependent methyltransferase [Thermoanaerobaculia bacterium]